MKLFGDLDFNHGQILRAVIETVTEFPSSPQPGELVFKDKKLYLCTEIQGAPTWVPLTNEVDIQVFRQLTAQTVWEIDYTETNSNMVVQAYDENNQMVIPDLIDIDTPGKVFIHFNQAVSGKAVFVVQASSLAAQSQGGVTLFGEDGKILQSLLPAGTGGTSDPLDSLPTATAYTYNVDGSVASSSETLNGLIKTDTYTYNVDGAVTQIVTTYNGRTRTESFTYNPDGSVASTSATIS